MNSLIQTSDIGVFRMIEVTDPISKKRSKFTELAEKRTQKVLDGIISLGNLHNTSNYEYTEADYRKIIRAIRAAVNDMQDLFEGNKAEPKRFKL